MKISSNLNLKHNKGSFLYQYLAAATSTLAIISGGMHNGWPSPSLHQLSGDNATVPVTNEEGSWLAVMPLIGAILGSLTAAITIDLFGRKALILFTAMPFFASWMMVAYAKSMAVLSLGRALGGMADGMTFTAVPMYLGEIAEPKIRGALGSSCSATFIFGIFLINVLGLYLSISVTALISSAIPIALFVTFWWMPESPYFLIMKNKAEDAKKSLAVFRGHKDVDVEFNRISVAVCEQMKNTGKFVDLFTVSSNRKALIIIIGLRTVQQFSGTMAITFYANTIFSHSAHLSATISTLLYFGIQFILAFVCSAVVDQSGRRPLLIVSLVGSALALLVEGLYFYMHLCTEIDVEAVSFVQIIGLIGYVVMFSVGMQTIPILMMCELFPTNVKAFALCLGDIYFCLAATAVSKFFQIVRDSFGLYVPFFTFAACCVIGLIFIVYFVPETKGKTLEEIQLNLRGQKYDEELEKIDNSVA